METTNNDHVELQGERMKEEEKKPLKRHEYQVELSDQGINRHSRHAHCPDGC